jgi:nitrous oxidase accessory protein NosD
MLSATGIAAAIAILAISVNVIDDEPTIAPAAVIDADHIVAADDSGDFKTIAEAVAAAADGETIAILPGTYEGSVVVDRDLTITGDTDDPGAVVVRIPDDGPTFDFNGVDVGYGFLFEDAVAEISHLTISGPGTGASALVASGGALTAHDLVEDLDPYVADPYAFLYVEGDTSGDIYDNRTKAVVLFDQEAKPTFRDNEVASVVRIRGRAYPQIEDNAIGGVWLQGSAAPVIRNNTIDFGTIASTPDGFGTCGIQLSPGEKQPTIKGNSVRGAPTGICALQARGAEITQNDIEVEDVGVELDRAEVSVRHSSITGDGDGIVVSGRSESGIENNSIRVTGRGLQVLSPATPYVVSNDICGDEGDIVDGEGVDVEIGASNRCRQETANQ